MKVNTLKHIQSNILIIQLHIMDLLRFFTIFYLILYVSFILNKQKYKIKNSLQIKLFLNFE